MGLKEAVEEMLKNLVAKAVTVGATAFIALNGFPLVMGYVSGNPPAGELITLLIIGVSYKVWMEAFVPVINAFFEGLQPAPTGKKVPVAGMAKTNYFKLV
jgi:hypothetical protein